MLLKKYKLHLHPLIQSKFQQVYINMNQIEIVQQTLSCGGILVCPNNWTGLTTRVCICNRQRRSQVFCYICTMP
jgi:hypothetical protein